MQQNQQISKTPESFILQGFDVMKGDAAKSDAELFFDAAAKGKARRWRPKKGDFLRLAFEEEPDVIYWVQWGRWFTTGDGWHHIPAPVVHRIGGGYRLTLCLLDVKEGLLASRVLPVLSDDERRVARALIELAFDDSPHEMKRGRAKMTERGLACPGVVIQPFEGQVEPWKVFVCGMWGQWVAGKVKLEARAADVRGRFPTMPQPMTKERLRRECYRMGLMGKT